MLPAPETVRYLSFSDIPRIILTETPFVNSLIFRPLVLTGGMMPNWNAELRSGACCAMAGDETSLSEDGMEKVSGSIVLK